jgi:hypothetical protein
MDRWLSALESKADKHTKFFSETGYKYTKVIRQYNGQNSSHAFVDNNTGDIYKPASWKAPAKGIRYNLYNDIDRLLQECDPYGGYLYR